MNTSNIDSDWHEYAVAFLKNYLETHETMHVDDLWTAGLEVPPSPRRLGHAITTARKSGWIGYIRTQYGVVARPSRHSNMGLSAVWHSNLYNQTDTQSIPVSRQANEILGAIKNDASL